jgi:hypothetical protein
MIKLGNIEKGFKLKAVFAYVLPQPTLSFWQVI